MFSAVYNLSKHKSVPMDAKFPCIFPDNRKSSHESRSIGTTYTATQSARARGFDGKA